MKRLYKNWFVHNMVAHPLSELAYWATNWCLGDRLWGWVHDVTIPKHTPGQGRG